MISRITKYNDQEFFEIYCPDCDDYLTIGEVIFLGEEVLCSIHNDSERLGFKKDIPHEHLSY